MLENCVCRICRRPPRAARDDAGLVFPVTAPVSCLAMVLHRRTTMSPWTTIKVEAPTFAEATSRFVRAVFPKVCAYALRLAPKLERGAWELLEVTLGPKRVFHQRALAGALQGEVGVAEREMAGLRLSSMGTRGNGHDSPMQESAVEHVIAM